MVSSVRQILGLALAAIGFLGSIIICALPWWKVTASRSAEVGWHGLWKFCAVWKMRQMHCETYPPLQALSAGVQTARVLVIVAIILGVFGIVLGVVGGKFTPFIKDQGRKCKVAITGGIIFIIAGLMVLISVCNFTYIISQNFYVPMPLDDIKIESGSSIYIGWVTAVLLFLGGGLLCSSCFPRDETNPSVRYRADP